MRTTLAFVLLVLSFFVASNVIGQVTNEIDSTDQIWRWDELAQVEVDHSYKPLQLRLSEDGEKFVRFVIWHQQWVVTNNLAEANTPLRLKMVFRRSRFLAYAQVSPRFIILTHFGLNNLTADNMNATGNNSDGPQLFLHDAWSELRISQNDALFIGAGLHYWKGISRLSNQSTLNFMTIDNSRPFVHWHSFGITDQFARHLGLYLKGQMGKFDYRIAANNPLNPAQALGAGMDFGGQSDLTYTGLLVPDEAGEKVGSILYEGYFRYNFLETEPTKLPFQVGTYFGQKKVLGLGGGFYTHPNGMYNLLEGRHQDVFHWGTDLFFDHPVRNGDALNAYISYIHFDYGDQYMSRWAGTGNNIYGHLGYFYRPLKIMPYIAFQNGDYQAFDQNLRALNVGINYLINGHYAKVTLDYHNIYNNPLEGGVNEAGNPKDIHQFRLQLHVYL